MTNSNEGYVIINIGHPATDKQYIVLDSFRNYKKDCIKDFCKDSGNSWNYWKYAYNFRCVKANQIINTI